MPSENEVRILGLTEEGKENVEAVSKLLIDGNLKWTNIQQEDVFGITSFKEEVMYVIDPTDGEEVDYLVKLGYPVIGPQCAITILKHDIRLTPSIVYPVHNLTMYKTQICFSNFKPKERKKYMDKIKRMGGNFTKILTDSTTHLVVKEVGSVKYFSAACSNIPIMTSQWIEHLWTHGQSRYISALKGKWDEFKCPIFLGCSVCATGFSNTRKNMIQNLVTKFGGTYCGAMTLNITTHLVVNKPEGKKYTSASQFGVKIVNIDWVFKSVEKKFCQDHNKYPVKHDENHESSVLKSSTPEKKTTKRNKNPAIHDVSNISVMMVNETVSTTITDCSRMSMSFLVPPSASSAKEDLLKFPTSKNYDQMLDNICVYIVGFTSKEEEKVKQLLSISGATRFNQLTPSITHIIVGSPSGVTDTVIQSIKQALNQKDRELWVITYKWLLQSLSSNEVKPELQFWCDDLVEKPKHLTEVEVTTINETTIYSRPNTILGQSSVMTHREDKQKTETTFNDMKDVLSQYMDFNNGGDVTKNNNDATSHDNNVTMNYHDVTEKGDFEETNFSDSKSLDCSKIAERALTFKGKSFLFYGFDDDVESEKITEIEAHKGTVLSAYSKKIADYAIVPATGWPVEKTVNNIVTDFWMDSCITENKLLPPDFHPLSTPFLISEDCFPLSDCVLCLSLYAPPLRNHLMGFIEDLGGIYQDLVARKDQPTTDDERLQKTTHLVVPKPEGDKFMGCQKWEIPCVHDNWLYECARKGEKVSEKKFLVLPENKETETEDKKSVFASGNTAMKRSYDEMVKPPKFDKADKIVKKYEKKLKAQKFRTENKETPLRVKFLRMNVKTPSHYIGRKNKNLSFTLEECFALLKTPECQQQQINSAIKNDPDTPVSVFLKRFLKDSIREKYDNCENEIVKDLLFEFVDDNTDTQSKLQNNLKFETSNHNISELCNALDQTENQNDETNMENDETNMENDETNMENDETNLKNDEINFENDITNLENGETSLRNNESTNFQIDETNAENADVANKPLKGVVLFVTKKLTNIQMEQNSMTQDLGGEFRWNYDSAVTHVVFQGKLNDTNKEFRKAKTDGKLIVSPHWLQACFETKTRVNEAEYSHLFNPNKSIPMLNMSSQSQRSNKSTIQRRSTRKSSSSTESDQEKSNVAIDSQEAREILRKTVENIISSTTKNSSAVHRIASNRGPSAYSSPVHLLRRNSSTTIKNENINTEKTESSQDVHVSWDDPTEREEMERIMKERSLQDKLKAEESYKQNETKSFREPLPPASGEKLDTFDKQQTSMDCEDENRMSQILRQGRTPSFLISSVSAEDKLSFASLINEQGGIYLNRDQYDPSCTHLIAKKPVRNEKFLSCLAAGKWILHTSYMQACRDAGHFVKEDAFEYGNPLSSIQPQTDLERLLMASAHRWRFHMNKLRNQGKVDLGAFEGWKVLLHINERQTIGFTRLLQSGHGVVVAKTLPYDGPLNITHAFVEPSRVNDSIDIMGLVTAGVHCCKPDYIAEFLMRDPPPSPSTLYIPQVQEILQKFSDNDISMGTPSKRRKMVD